MSPEDRAGIPAALKATKKPAIEHRRMNALLLLIDGWAEADVAEALFLDGRTIAEYRSLYEASGASGVSGLGYQGNPNRVMTSAEIEALTAHLSAQNFMTSKAVCVALLAQIGQREADPRPVEVLGDAASEPHRGPSPISNQTTPDFNQDRVDSNPIFTLVTPLSSIRHMDVT